MNRSELARYLDHTLLKPSATLKDIMGVAEEGKRYGVASVCVNPIWVYDVSRALEGSGVDCCAVAGFPLGTHHPDIVAQEAMKAVDDGASEIDIVMNVGLARMGNWQDVGAGISEVKRAIGNNILKVILEICELDDDQIRMASRVSIDAGADFIKTSTGFGSHGATVEAVKIMAEVAGGKAGVKAAGGIRSYDDTIRMIEAGATRIGTSSTITILENASE